MRAILSLVLILAAAAGCALAVGSREADTTGNGSSISVVASFYPLAYAVQRVGGDAVTVTNLTPPGVEPHDLELSPEAIEGIAEADLVVLLSGRFQPAVEDVVEAEAAGIVVDAAGATSVSASSSVPSDPHLWLDPTLFASVARRLTSALGQVRPADATVFNQNEAQLDADLASLDRAFRRGLDECATRLVIVSHAAFGYLASAYDLEQQAISGLSPGSEPDPERIAQLARHARAAGATTVFAEDLAPADVVDVLAAEADLDTAVLSPLEGLTEAQVAAGDDYLSVMRRNLETLRDGLACT